MPCNAPYNAFYELMNNVTLHNTYKYMITLLESSLNYITTDDKQAIVDGSNYNALQNWIMNTL